EAHPCLAAEDAGARIEGEHLLHCRRRDDEPALVLRRVVVAAPEAAGDDSAVGRALDKPGDFVRRGWLGNFGHGWLGAPPARQLHRASRPGLLLHLPAQVEATQATIRHSAA